MYRDHRKGPGGPPGGATYLGGPRGLKVEGNQPLVGWGAPLGPPPMRLGLGTLGWGSSPLPWGARQPLPPFGRRPPLDLISRAGAPPPTGAYIKGGGRAAHNSLGRLPPPLQHLSRRSSAKPCRRAATSTTTPSCCWIYINLSFPLAGSRRRRRRCIIRVLNAEVPSVRHSVIGDLDHVEYAFLIPVL